MACKRCGDSSVSDKYRCHTCEVAVGRFKWCVITKVPEGFGDNDGACFDEIVDFQENMEALNMDTGVAWKPFKGKRGYIHFKKKVFEVGEIIPITSSFGREMVAMRRKPSKWDIEYEEFSGRDYKKALALAIKLTKQSDNEKDNLEFLEQKIAEKEQLTERQKTLRASQDPFKVIYGWIKQNHITLKESKVLLGEVFKNEKKVL